MKKGHANVSRRALGMAASLTLESLEQRRFFSAAALDPSYGMGGVVHTDFPGPTNDRAADMVAFNGGFLTVGNAGDHGALVKYAQDEAQRDNTFGNQGIVSIPLNVLSSTSRVLIDANGKILVGGSLNGAAAVARFNANGTVDTTFGGGDGVVAQSALGGSVTGLQMDGTNIVISGEGNQQNFAVARLTSSGTPDTSFGGGAGYVVTGMTEGSDNHHVDAWINDIAIEGGKIVAVGNVDFFGAHPDVQVARYNNNGTLDSSFAGSGTRRIDIGYFAFDRPDSGVRVLVKNGATPKIQIGAMDEGNFMVLQLEDSGDPDVNFGTFGSDGVSRPHPGTAAVPLTGGLRAMTRDAAGNIIVAGISADGAAVSRITPTGAVDLTFNGGQPAIVQANSESTDAEAVVANADGSISTFGEVFPDAAHADYAFVNLTAGGNVQPVDGVVTDGLVGPATDAASALITQSDGSAIVAGVTSNENGSFLALAKYTPNGALDATFGNGGKVSITPAINLTILGGTSDGAGGGYLLATDDGQATVIVAHITSAGALDAAFGNGGLASDSDANATLFPTGIARSSGGNLFVSGQKNNGGDVKGFVVKFNASGAIDGTFGSSGTATVDFDTAHVGGTTSALTGITLLADGSIVGGGFYTVDGSSLQPAAVHLNSVGNLSNGGLNGSGAFGNGGLAVAPDSGQFFEPLAIAVDPATGAALLGGTLIDPNAGTQSPAAAKFNANGQFDTTYGSSGLATVGSDGDFKGMTLQAGKVLLAANVAGSGAEVIRFDNSGQLDTSFDDDGIAPVNTPSEFDAVGLGLAPGDRILIGGTTEDDLAVAALVHSDVSQTPPPVAHAGNDASINEGGTLHFDGSTSTGTGLSYAWDLDGDGQFDDSTSPTPSFTFADGNATIVVSLKVTDSQSRSDVDTLIVTVHNVAPTLAVSGSGSSTEGSTYSVALSSHDPGADTIAHWTINWGDGNTDTLNGNPNSALHTYADNGSYTISATATDEDGTYNATGHTVTVANAKPTAAVSGPSALQTGQAGSFVLGATDPSSADMAANFTFQIDWDDNGTIDQTVNGPVGTSVSHTFAAAGNYTVKVLATDKDGGTSTSAATLNVAVTNPAPPPPTLNAQLVNNPNTGKTDLVITGSAGNDGVVLLPGAHGSVNVWLGLSNAGNFSPTGRVLINAGDGNDIVVLLGVTSPVEVYGGAGNDIVTGGDNGSILVGGTGNDLLIGGAGRDVIIGGTGADTILGSSEDDLLVAGTTSYDADSASLNKILAEWSSSRTYANRVANIQGSNSVTAQFAARANGNVFLKTDGSAATVFDDGVRDIITGGAGRDWFLFNGDTGVRDSVIDEASNETGSDID